MLGASLNELGLVALLVALVLLAAKVSAIGEAIGGFLAGARSNPANPTDHADHADEEGKKSDEHGST
jgi:Sec-independent protein translocase protein TatA